MPFQSELRTKRNHLYFLLVWLALCLFCLYMVISSEIKIAEQQFNQDINELTTDVQHKLLANDAVLSGFSAFLQAVEETDQNATARYAATAMAPYPHIYMLEVAREVPQGEKDMLEASIRKSGLRNFAIKNFPVATPPAEIIESTRATLWPIIFIYPPLSIAQDIFGVRLESVPFLEKTLRLAAQSNQAVASPTFTLYEGGSGYILLRNIVRVSSSPASGQPNMFGSAMIALLLNKTEHLLPAKLAGNPLSMTAELLSLANNEPSLLFQQTMPPAHWLDIKTLPRFTRIIATGNASQPVRLRFEHQLRWTNCLSPGAIAVMTLLIGGMLLVSMNVQRYHFAISSAALEHERAEHLAMHDALTRLPNRHLLTDRYEQVFHRWERQGTKFALLVIDLDHFKQINDTLGHEAGDAVLVATAERISQAIRASDTVARYGGDEFVVLVADVLNDADVLSLGEKLCCTLREPVLWGTIELFPTCSMGIALCPDDGESFQSLFQQADRAMYQVKERGRNGVALAKAV